MTDPRKNSDQQMLLVLQNIRAIRERMNQDLDAIEARIEKGLPEKARAHYQGLEKADWKKKIKSW